MLAGLQGDLEWKVLVLVVSFDLFAAGLGSCL